MNIQITPNAPTSPFAKRVWLAVSIFVVVFVAYSFYEGHQQSREWVAAGGSTKGTVLTSVTSHSYRQTGSSGQPINRTTNVVTFSFTDKSGKQYIVTDPNASHSYAKGDQVDVIYNPENPDDAHIKNLLD